MFPVVWVQRAAVPALGPVERGAARLQSEDLSPDHAPDQWLRLLLLQQLRGGHSARVWV